jgi:uncharacterized protein (TIGR02996 family)
MTFPIEEARSSRGRRAELLVERKSRRVASGLPPKGFVENEDLLRAVLEQPDDDAPRWAYAAWMRAQNDPDSVMIGEFVESELRIAETFRVDPHADVSAMRRHAPIESLFDIDLMVGDGVVGWPGRARGFVERIGVRANRLIEIADELFSVAPIRYLTLLNLADAVDEVAAWPGLSRIHALTFQVVDPATDLLTDDVVERLLRSPYLANVAVIWLDGQTQLTQRAYRSIVSAPTLPRLSYLNVDASTLTCWVEPISREKKPGTLSFFDRAMQSPPNDGDLRMTPKRVLLRPEDWIIELEREVGYMPCLHPEEHYGGYWTSIEAPVEHPIALDAAIMARRGVPVPDPGPKPSMMARREQGACAICGSAELSFEQGAGDMYGDPDGRSGGIWVCSNCGTRWYADQWPERPLPF